MLILKHRFATKFCAILLIFPFNLSLAIAQLSSAPTGIDTTRQLIPLNESVKYNTKKNPITLPKLPSLEGNKNKQLHGQLKLMVKEIKFSGNTVLPNDVIIEILKRYINRYVTTNELQQLRFELTKLYISIGYINSGVVLPDQDVSSGVIQLIAIEGKLTKIELSNLGDIERSYILDKLKWSPNKILNIKELQKSLLLLQQNRLVNKFNAELKPTNTLGQSQLSLDIDEAKSTQWNIVWNNHRAPSVGSFYRGISFVENNLSGYGDIFEIGYGETSGLRDFNIAYQLKPINSSTSFRVFYLDSQSKVIESPFNILDISSLSKTVGITFDRSIEKSAKHELNLSLSFEKRKSHTFLFNESFSFSEGVVDGISRVSVLRFTQEKIKRSAKHVLAIRSRISMGIDVLDPSNAIGTPNNSFLTWLGQFQWVRELSNRHDQFILRSDIQVSNTSLLPMEKFSLGGVNSIRGYRENVIARDQGIILSLEYRRPILQQWLKNKSLNLSLFTDYGWAENKSGAKTLPRDISSVGIGILYQFKRYLSLKLYAAKSLRTIQQDNHNIQDDGIHGMVRLSY
ncbi:MAG: ShlB/FhaC/HecB family hemolysin secretion/activation protein [Methylococcales bacterium]|nr:ShlB/FhaC/HecB family hemolysin secretion/activation protein [Methylococcales bacterium]